jgi:putative tryptophan/tyrosine transport system substrate-binding protein
MRCVGTAARSAQPNSSINATDNEFSPLDLLGIGIVASLARPGGNVTGSSVQAIDLAAKRLEILRELVPGLHRLEIMAHVGGSGAMLEMAEVQATARALGLEASTSELRRAEDIAPAFETFKDRADALYVAADPLHRVSIATLAIGLRLPTMYGQQEYVAAGGLVSYGPNLPDLFRRAADFVDKILHGTKPSDIPVEQPTKFDLIINLTTAKALGLAVPLPLLGRADEVIE